MLSIILQAIFPFALVASGQPVILSADTFNLTGHPSILVSNIIQGSPGTVIRYDRVEPGDTTFLFKAITGSQFIGIEFIGPNGNTHIIGSGYMGCIRVRSTSKITNCTFANWDKWAVDIRGIRNTLSDTTKIDHCTFSGMKRDGFGYAVWCQYGTALITNCTFKSGRHFIDAGSEGHRVILRNNSFDLAYISAIHTHEYTGGLSGAGMDIFDNTFYKNATDIDIDQPFPPAKNNIEGNIYWDGKSTSFWLKSHNAIVEVYSDGKLLEVIDPQKWEHFYYRVKVTLRIFGNGVAYLDDYLEPFASRYYTIEDGRLPKVRYFSTTSKVDRFIGEQVSGDYCLRIRVEGSAVEIY